MKKNIVDKNTYALISDFDKSRIIKSSETNLISEKINNIVDNSCKYYGSSLNGRIAGSRDILGISYKVPIVLSELNNIILFPTTSLRKEECSWLNLYAIDSYKKLTKNTVEIIFINNIKIIIKISYNSLNRQILTASRLSDILNVRNS